MTDTEAAWLRLHLTPGVGRTALTRLYEAFGSPEAALAASPRERIEGAGLRPDVAHAILPADAASLHRCRKQLQALGVRLLSRWDEGYPPLLQQLPDPPALLYLRGELPPLLEGLAVVGARRATVPTCRFVRRLAAEIAAHEIVIISGLARGVDTAAHLGALDAAGCTIAVLGCGIDLAYPRENRRLLEAIVDGGGAVISELPPGAPPLAGHFPGRNRIVSGLARGVLVAEAAAGSGSLLTADFALEQGREVFVLPGPPYDRLCAGSNDLLKQGAQPVTDAADVLLRLWPQRPSAGQREAANDLLEQLAEPARSIFALLAPTPRHIDEIIRASGLTPGEVSATLLDLELRGGVEQLPGLYYCRRG